MDIERIALEINDEAIHHPIGKLHEIRKNLGLNPRSKKKIFSRQTILRDYAFHDGARRNKEIQFNIGVEKNNLLRYGIAFSFETSQTLQIEELPIFEPKIQRYNEFIKANFEKFSDLFLWYYTDEEKRNNVTNTLLINDDLFKPDYFIFLGKESKKYAIEDILIIFDRLLPLYEYVEGNQTLGEVLSAGVNEFNFISGNNSKIKSTYKITKPKKFECDLRHNLLQDKLYDILSKQNGQNNVGTENYTSTGTKIDLVLKKQKLFWFYEIKTSSTLKLCLREGISQLLEYSYWPGSEIAEKLIVIAEHNITADAKNYLFKLRNELKIPVYYQTLDIEKVTLSSLY